MKKRKEEKMITEGHILRRLNTYAYEPVRPVRMTIWQKAFRVVLGLLLIGAAIFFFTQPLNAQEIVHKFKNPSFSGQGTGAHYLTIENQEFSRKKAIEEALEAARKAAERAEDNTTLAKFIRNLESRIYAQMAKQLVESMFSKIYVKDILNNISYFENSFCKTNEYRFKIICNLIFKHL